MESKRSVSLFSDLVMKTEESGDKVTSDALSCGEEEQTHLENKKRCSSSSQSIQLLGVHSTSDYLQKCIQYCSLFFPDCHFVKDKLVRFWIAEGCIEVDANERMEDVANSTFATLVNEEIIIPSGFDTRYRQLKYKVNAPKFSSLSHIYLRIDQGSLDAMCGEALHLTWHSKTLDKSVFERLKINCKQVRTFRVHEDCGASIKVLPFGLFIGFKSLRTLDFSDTSISELPYHIMSLESLRCLDVSRTPIKKLPGNIDNLQFLQTLRLVHCSRLFELPTTLGGLTELRHLDFDIVKQLDIMPGGMGNLTKLQTFQGFIVGTEEGRKIRELKSMNDITGSFYILRLENVASAEEAKEVALADKQRIENLELRWFNREKEVSADASEILEYLQPHFHLRELAIRCFSGSKLPSWISNPSFTDLSSITLNHFRNCESLPSLGQLPSLQILRIIQMENIRDINSLFCRPHCVAEELKAFPRLDRLVLTQMTNLEEWSGIGDGDFPCLRHIKISECPKLSVLPCMSHLCSLQYVSISYCKQLVSLPEGLLSNSLEDLVISGCPKLILKDGVQDRFRTVHAKNIWVDFQKISLD